MLVESRKRMSPRPGIGGTAGRPPVLITIFGAVSRRSPPAFSATRTVFASAKLPSPKISSTFGVDSRERCPPLRNCSTTPCLRRYTSAMFTRTSPPACTP